MTQTAKTKAADLSANKPIDFIIKLLWGCWFFWVLYRILGFPYLASREGQEIIFGIFWQFIITLPALLFTPAVIKAKSPYALIITHLVTLLYFSSACVFFVVYLYAQNKLLGWASGVEAFVLLGINILLFMLLKRLPPMYRTA